MTLRVFLQGLVFTTVAFLAAATLIHRDAHASEQGRALILDNSTDPHTTYLNDPPATGATKQLIAQQRQQVPTNPPPAASPAQSAPPATPISSKAASPELSAPESIASGEVVKGRLAARKSHFWQIKAPGGRYRVVLDVKRAIDENSNLNIVVEAVDHDGRALERLLMLNEIDVRRRLVANIDSGKSNSDVILRISGASAILDYWLGIFPIDATPPFPYFTKTPKVEALQLGRPVSTVVAPLLTDPDGAWYSIDLDAQDYRISAQFTRSDGAKGNVMGKVDMFGPLGDTGKGHNRICLVNEIDTSAACAAKLILAEKASVLFRVRSEHNSGYKVVFKVEPRSSN